MITRSEKVKAGIFVLGSACLFVLILLFLGYLQVKEEGVYYYSLFEDVKSLSSGAPVKYQGVSIGKVTEISVPKPGKKMVRVRYRVDHPELILASIQATLGYASPLSGQQYVSLSMPAGVEAGQHLPPESEIASKPSDVTVTLGALQESLVQLNGLLKENRERFGTLLENSNEVVGNMNAVLTGEKAPGLTKSGGLIKIAEDLEKLIPSVQLIAEKTEKIIDNAAKATESSQKMFAEVRGLSHELNGLLKTNRKSVEEGVKNFRDGMISLKGLIRENRKPLQTAVSDIERLAGTLDKMVAEARETLSENQIHADFGNLSESWKMLARATTEAEYLARALQRISGEMQSLLQENARHFSAAIKNIEDAGENLKEFSRNLRSSPSLLLRSAPPKKRKISKD
ncbi:MAG: MlaD family protein [Candidatus Brocadiia bacterium]